MVKKYKVIASGYITEQAYVEAENKEEAEDLFWANHWQQTAEQIACEDYQIDNIEEIK